MKKIKCPICNSLFTNKELINHECLWEEDIAKPIIKGYILLEEKRKK